MLLKIVRLVRHMNRYSRAKSAFTGRAISYFDVGSAGYMPLSLRLLQRDGVLSAIGFDPGRTDWSIGFQEWLDRLLRLPKLQHLPIALGDRDGLADIYVTRHPGCSSLLKPDQDAVARFEAAPMFEVKRVASVALRRMDAIVAELGLPCPEIVKMDVQGAESLVLEGMGALLDEVVCLEFETRMRPLYSNEWCFPEYYVFLRQRGFDLLKLEQHQSLEGESIEYMAYFARPPRSTREECVRSVFMEANGIVLKSGYGALVASEGHLME